MIKDKIDWQYSHTSAGIADSHSRMSPELACLAKARYPERSRRKGRRRAEGLGIHKMNGYPLKACPSNL